MCFWGGRERVFEAWSLNFFYRLYKTTFGLMPKYIEWVRDINQLSTNSPEAKLSFAKEWVARAEFLAQYPHELTNLEFVNKLLQTYGGKRLSLNGCRSSLDEMLPHGVSARQRNQTPKIIPSERRVIPTRQSPSRCASLLRA